MARLTQIFGLAKTGHQSLLLQKSIYSFRNKSCLFSSSSAPQNLPPNITFRPAVIKNAPCSSSEKSHKSPPPLVLCFGWLTAKDNHLEKYRQFWTSRGYDVISVAIGLKPFLLPFSKDTGSVAFTSKLVKYLSSMEAGGAQPYERIIFHNFSVGNYVSSIFRYQLNKEIEKGKNQQAKYVREAFRGMVIDSVSFFEDSPHGTAVAVTSFLPLKLLIQACMNTYYYSVLPLIRYVALPAEKITKGNSLPALFLNSLDDQVSSAARTKELISLWRSRGVTVREKFWTSSGHVQHFRLHNQEYVKEVEAFLKSIGMPH